MISFKVFRERFGSRVVLWPADPDTGALKIDTEYLDGPFKYMRSGWIFTDRPGGGCHVEFFVDFEFRNALLQRLIGVALRGRVRQAVGRVPPHHPYDSAAFKSSARSVLSQLNAVPRFN